MPAAGVQEQPEAAVGPWPGRTSRMAKSTPVTTE